MTYIQATSSPLNELVRAGSGVERLATGFTFTEGPIWHPREQVLYFSDMPADVRRRVTLEGTVSEVLRPSRKCNGMTLDRRARPPRVRARLQLARARATGMGCARRWPITGRACTSTAPTTSACAPTGPSTSPTPGTVARRPSAASGRVTSGGRASSASCAGGGQAELDLVVSEDEFDMPNGLCFSPDESLLYVNDTSRAHVKVFDVLPDGRLANGRLFHEGIASESEGGVPDGMKCDERGNVWVTGPGWHLGHLTRGRAPRGGGRAGGRREPRLGRPRLEDALHRRVHVHLHAAHGGRAAP